MPRHWAHGLQACLGDVVILSYYHGQLKIAELPVDAFRILQALEWEVQSGSIPSTGVAHMGSNLLASPPGTLPNPQKQLIYRSKVTRILAQLSAAIEELSADKYLCIYLAANAPAVPAPRQSDGKSEYAISRDLVYSLSSQACSRRA